VIVGLALRPLRKVAATATRVSELPLHTGEVTLYERVPESEADPHTEVGQVGAALNRMLDHIHGALHARQQSEMRVRQFVADASHELRTPLASIRGYAELTRRGREETGPDTRHALGRIESEAGRMTLLVEDLLLLARLDQGRPLLREEVDLAEIARDAVDAARVLDPDRPLELHVGAAVPVIGDGQRLRQVVDNLLANVRAHTPADGAVHVRVARNGTNAVLEVADSGAGLDEEELERVFERFHRGDPSRSRASGGVGLGLSIVAAVAEAHGGSASAESVPGHGSTFCVTLPLAT
jgi:two-component system OmpR family sensor kinase